MHVSAAACTWPERSTATATASHHDPYDSTLVALCFTLPSGPLCPPSGEWVRAATYMAQPYRAFTGYLSFDFDSKDETSCGG